MRRRRKGFTLVELLVVVAIIALLIGILLPAIGRARELANRTKSAANIRGIGQAMIAYASSFNGSFPVSDPDESETIPASLYILIEEGDVPDQMFINPSTTDTPDLNDPGDPDVNENNFDSEDNLSYSFMPIYHDALRINWTDKRLSSAYAIAADDNDGERGSISDIDDMTAEEKEAWNSTNHQGDGQNVLFGDGHAAFNNDPLAGVDDDNVYAFGDDRTSGWTTNDTEISNGTYEVDGKGPQEDSVLVPVEEMTFDDVGNNNNNNGNNN